MIVLFPILFAATSVMSFAKSKNEVQNKYSIAVENLQAFSYRWNVIWNGSVKTLSWWGCVCVIAVDEGEALRLEVQNER